MIPKTNLFGHVGDVDRVAAQIWAVEIIDRVTGEIRIRVVENDRTANSIHCC